MSKHFRLCDCEGRPEPHWEFDEVEHWMIFLASRKVTTHEFNMKLMDGLLSKDTDNTVRFEAIWLMTIILQSIWHMGGVMDDPSYIRHMIGEFDLRKWTNFDRSWAAVRKHLEPHPEIEGGLWFPPLEKVREAEFDGMHG